MVAVKAGQAQSFLRSLDARYDAVLVYGPDAGLVAELSQLAADSLAKRDAPPGEIIRIEDPDLERHPERLAIELQTMPMFGGRKVVRSTASRRVTAALLKPLLEPARLAATLVIEAGSLRPDDGLRVLFEKSARCAAIACYADTARDLEVLVREAIARAGQSITPEARELLISRLGADRALSRSEIDKLVLFAAGQPTIGVEDVDALIGDGSELSFDKIVLAAASGRAAGTVSECDRAVASGENAQAVIAALERYVHRLERVCAALAAGRSLDDAVRQLRPPVHFKQRDALESQSRYWTAERLVRARALIATAAKAARLNSTLETAIAERLLLDIAVLARAEPRPGQGGA